VKSEVYRFVSRTLRSKSDWNLVSWGWGNKTEFCFGRCRVRTMYRFLIATSILLGNNFMIQFHFLWYLETFARSRVSFSGLNFVVMTSVNIQTRPAKESAIKNKFLFCNHRIQKYKRTNYFFRKKIHFFYEQ
jgi:hypothetical protein